MDEEQGGRIYRRGDIYPVKMSLIASRESWWHYNLCLCCNCIIKSIIHFFCPTSLVPFCPLLLFFPLFSPFYPHFYYISIYFPISLNPPFQLTHLSPKYSSVFCVLVHFLEVTSLCSLIDANLRRFHHRSLSAHRSVLTALRVMFIQAFFKCIYNMKWCVQAQERHKDVLTIKPKLNYNIGSLQSTCFYTWPWTHPLWVFTGQRWH